MNYTQGKIVWITGLSGAGKSTLALNVKQFIQKRNKPVILLDGDELREVMNSQEFTRSARVEIGIRYCKLCRLITSQGINVVIAVIGLFKEIYEWNNRNMNNIYTIFLDVPLEELKRRDSKKIYSRALSKDLINVIGIDIPIDYPKNVSLHIPWQPGMTIQETQHIVLKRLESFII